MGLPRSRYVRDGEEGVYHCFSRCVRRAFLCGFDPITRRDYSHRKTWLVQRLRHLAAIFAIDVCGYSVLDNHYHTILRTRPDIVASWPDRLVASRWLTLFPNKLTSSPTEHDISALAASPILIAKLRLRLSSLSWFMGQLNEFIARAANKEDGVKGRFWESRFKSQTLLDDAAIAACMAYVDLNPIRAGLAATPELSDFTSIQQRIRAWHAETFTAASLPTETPQHPQSGAHLTDKRLPQNPDGHPNPSPETSPLLPPSANLEPLAADWLCPIQSHSRRRGILQMSTADYLQLVDFSGRMIRSKKRGAIDPELAPILLRIGANPDAWIDTVSHFASSFRLAAGLLSHLRAFADRIGNRWLKGVSAARVAFALSPPQFA